MAPRLYPVPGDHCADPGQQDLQDVPLSSHLSSPTYSGYTILPAIVRNRLSSMTSFLRNPYAATTVTATRGRLQCADPRTRPAFQVTKKDTETLQSTYGAGQSSRSSSHESVETISDLEETQHGGIDWNTAAVGARLWHDATYPSGQRKPIDPAIRRRMYIDGLRYMNMALPAELTPNEVDLIGESLPQQVRDRLDNGQDGTISWRLRPLSEKNILRQGVSRLVYAHVCILLFVLPILVAAFNSLLQYEREHQVSERVLAGGLTMANTLGQRGPAIRDAIVQFGEGPVGRQFVYLGIWVVDGVVGGVNDGVVKSVRRPPGSVQRT